jgi:exonuclease SbcD
VTLVDLAADGRVKTSTIRVPVGRPVRTIEGTLEALLREPDPAARAAFVRARLSDKGVVLDARQRLEAVYPHVVEVHQDDLVEPGRTGPLEVAATVTPLDRVLDFWQASTRAEPVVAEAELLRHALEAAVREVS